MQKYDWYIKIYGKCAIACGSKCNQSKTDGEKQRVGVYKENLMI